MITFGLNLLLTLNKQTNKRSPSPSLFCCSLPDRPCSRHVAASACVALGLHSVFTLAQGIQEHFSSASLASWNSFPFFLSITHLHFLVSLENFSVPWLSLLFTLLFYINFLPVIWLTIKWVDSSTGRSKELLYSCMKSLTNCTLFFAQGEFLLLLYWDWCNSTLTPRTAIFGFHKLPLYYSTY